MTLMKSMSGYWELEEEKNDLVFKEEDLSWLDVDIGTGASEHLKYTGNKHK